MAAHYRRLSGLIDVLVEEGATVNAGDSLAIVEAMKMENVLKAERSGTIEQIFEKVGSALEVDQKILAFGLSTDGPAHGSS